MKIKQSSGLNKRDRPAIRKATVDASQKIIDLSSPTKKHLPGLCCVEEEWEITAIGKRGKANEARLLEKYKDKIFRDTFKGKIEDRVITGILWNVVGMAYMVTTELISGGDECEYCINEKVRNLILK